MKILSKSIAFFFVITFIAIQANAQVQILEKNALEKIQNGHSHVVVNELHFPESEDFLDVFKKYWTLTKGVDFISSENLSGSLVAGDSYFSIEALHISGYYGSQQIYYYLNLWVPSAKSLKDKNFKIEHEEELAHIAISADFGTMKETMKTNGMFFDFNSEGRLFHWHPGLLKNYLQLLTAELKTGKKLDYHDDMTDKSQVKALSTQTLFIAEDNLNKVTAFVNKQKVMDIKEITKDYKFN
ncbi:hypothetical protein [Mucilaginibacter sp. BT774]|uniref:hypothetical protein n=1 Tax=Mucilaginibacter sp. BT774 TaxID=3062276 RepID=UPI002677569E|nr:hypothetical protein [Mucilaginibacter sp. BT774]MDO3626175.1 hypothetical protein [Mucilaginibacter sp. BT774]